MSLGTFGEQQLFIDSTGNTATTAKYNLGTRRTQNGVDYIYTQNGGPASTTEGYGLSHHTTVTDVGYTDTTADEKCFGVAVSVIAKDSYGWLATRGPVSVYSTAGLTAQKPITLGAAGVFATADSSTQACIAGVAGATVSGTSSGTVNLDV
jgi:hypothetical protein